MEHSEQRRTVVILRKRGEEYGIHLMELEKVILVYYIKPDSPAANVNGSVLYIGDRVLAIGESEKMRNRKSVEGLHPAEVIELINSHRNEVSLRVLFHKNAYQLLRQQFGSPLESSYDRRSVYSLPGHLSPPPPPEQSNGATKAIRGIRKHIGRAMLAFGKKLSGFDTPTAVLSHAKTVPSMQTDINKRNTNNQHYGAPRGNRNSAMTTVSETAEEKYCPYLSPVSNEGVYDEMENRIDGDLYFEVAPQSEPPTPRRSRSPIPGPPLPPKPQSVKAGEFGPRPAKASAQIEPASLPPPHISLPLQIRMSPTMSGPQLTPSSRDHDVTTPLGALALGDMSYSGSLSGDGDSYPRGLDEPDSPASQSHRILKDSRSTCTEDNTPAATRYGYLMPRAADESASSTGPMMGNWTGRVMQEPSSRASSRLPEYVDYSNAPARQNSQVAESTVQEANTHSSYILLSPPSPANPLRPNGGSATSSPETSGPPVNLVYASVATGAVANCADAGAGAGERDDSIVSTQYQYLGFRFQHHYPSSAQSSIYGMLGGGDVRMRAPQRHGHEVGPLAMTRPPSPPESLNPDSLLMDNEENIFDD